MNIFEAIAKSVDMCIAFNNINTFHWSLPRQSGVTTYFKTKINMDLLEGKKVAYVTFSKNACNLMQKDIYKEYKGNFTCIHLTDEKQILGLKGTSLDRIYVDSICYAPKKLQNEFIASIIPVIASNPNAYLLWIDTSEGSLNGL